MLAVIVSPRGFTTALVSEASIVPRASHHEITLVACLGRVLGAEPQVGCRLIDSHSYSYSFVSHPPLPNQYVQFVAAYGSPHTPGFFRLLFRSASAQPQQSLKPRMLLLFPPDRSGFMPITLHLSLCRYRACRSAESITDLHRGIQQLRCHAGISCLGNPAFSAEMSRVRGRVLITQANQPLPPEPRLARFRASGSPRASTFIS